MQDLRFGRIVINSDNLNAVANRLTSQGVIKINPDFAVIKIQDGARQCFPVLGCELDDQSRLQFDVWIKLGTRHGTKQGFVDITEGEIGTDVDGLFITAPSSPISASSSPSAISPQPSITVIGSSSKVILQHLVVGEAEAIEKGNSAVALYHAHEITRTWFSRYRRNCSGLAGPHRH